MNETPRHRVAVVDDEPSLCRALQRLLRAAGFEVDTFACGEAFLASLSSRIPACVILDVHMPGMTGLEVQARLADERRDVPVIMITCCEVPAAQATALAAGAVAFLRKPVSEDVLLAAVRRCLPGVRPKGGPGEEQSSRTINGNEGRWR